MLFGWGSTSAADALAIGSVTQWFVLGLVPYTVFFVLIRGYFALEDTKTPALINLALNAVNVLVAIALFAAVSDAHKVQALAAAYLPTYLFAAVVTWAMLARRLGGLPTDVSVRTGVRLTVAVVPATLLMWLLATASTSLVGSTRFGALVGICIGLAAAVPTYIWLARRMRVQEVGDLIGMVSARLSR